MKSASDLEARSGTRLLRGRQVTRMAGGVLCSLLVLAIASGTSSGAPDTLRVTGDISKSVVKIGERVSVRISLELPEPSARIIAPPAPVSFGPLDVVASDSIPAGTDSAGWQIELAFFQLGELNVDVIPFALQTSTETIPVRLNSYVISVVSTLPDSIENAEIRDIKGPLEIPLRPRWWRILIAALSLVALALATFWWFRRRRSGSLAIVPFEPPVPPETQALRALRDLEEESFPARGMIKEHYARLSLILREYMEGRFRVPAVESTTDEIRQSLSGRQLFNHGSETRLLVILDEADLVKFAKLDPGKEASAEALEGSRSWVELTTRSWGGSPHIDADPGSKDDDPGSKDDETGRVEEVS